MRPFLDDDFLLHSDTARYLYHQHAAPQPIIDYHCHLPPDQIAENRQFENLTQIWLYGDHYKWRAMRSNGIAERYCTGGASDFEKFEKWAETVPYTLRNPLYHWTHLELRRYFGIEEILGPTTAKAVYERASGLLQTPEFSVHGLLKKANVRVICTTDDPVDSLEHHRTIAASDLGIQVLPTFRADKLLGIDDVVPFNEYLNRLEAAADVDIVSYDDLLTALRRRHDFFAEMGGKLSDHGLEHLYADEYTEEEISTIFSRARGGKAPDRAETRQFRSAVLFEWAKLDHEKGWTQQFHLGALRNNNTRLLGQLGPDTGWDSIGDWPQAQALSKFLNRLDAENKLAKTILYNLNPADNEVMAAMVGNFNDGSTPGKVQFGSGWWFLDQKDGMERQLNALSNLGLLSRFVGMLTDSRSFMSYPRHEYFRRILCNLLGQDVENGELPNDRAWLGQVVENISYGNAKAYFEF